MLPGLSQDDRTVLFGQTDMLKRTDAVHRERRGLFQGVGERDTGDEDPTTTILCEVDFWCIRIFTRKPFQGLAREQARQLPGRQRAASQGNRLS